MKKNEKGDQNSCPIRVELQLIEEEEAVLDLYMHALGMAGPAEPES